MWEYLSDRSRRALKLRTLVLTPDRYRSFQGAEVNYHHGTLYLSSHTRSATIILPEITFWQVCSDWLVCLNREGYYSLYDLSSLDRRQHAPLAVERILDLVKTPVVGSYCTGPLVPVLERLGPQMVVHEAGDLVIQHHGQLTQLGWGATEAYFNPEESMLCMRGRLDYWQYWYSQWRYYCC